MRDEHVRFVLGSNEVIDVVLVPCIQDIYKEQGNVERISTRNRETCTGYLQATGKRVQDIYKEQGNVRDYRIL